MDDTTPAAGTDVSAPADERLTQVGVVTRLLKRPDTGAFIGAVAVFLLFAWTARQVNWAGDFGIWSTWLNTASYDGIIAVPVALLMIGGEFDLSAGVMIGSSGLLLGLLTTRAHWNIWPAIVVVLLFGVAIGLFNGFAVVKTKLPSFIITLGTFFMLRGINAGATISLTGGVSINDIDKASGFGFAHRLFASIIWPRWGLGVAVVWWVVITAVAAWVLARTRFGNWTFSVGGDPVAARNVGVPVSRTKITLFVTTSTVAAFWGILTAVSLRGMQSNEGVGREFEFIIAAVVGGCLLTGGYGSVVGAAFGAAIIGMAQIGIISSGWDSNWVYFFEGAVLVTAVMLNTAIRRRAEQAR
jgi:simple sugar transport system permease protein